MTSQVLPFRAKKGPPDERIKNGLDILSRAAKYPGCQTGSSAYPTFNVKNATNEWKLNPSLQTSGFYEAPKSLDQQLGTKNIGTLYGYDTKPICPNWTDSDQSKPFYKNLDAARVHDSLEPYYWKPHPCKYPTRIKFNNYVAFR